MSESDEQIAVIQWFRLTYKDKLIFAIPNGAFLGGTKAGRGRLMAKYKSEGLTPGVSDLFIAEPMHGYHGLFLEMKDKGKTLCSVTGEQRQFLESMRERDYLAGWASGFDQAKDVIMSYMGVGK